MRFICQAREERGVEGFRICYPTTKGVGDSLELGPFHIFQGHILHSFCLQSTYFSVVPRQGLMRSAEGNSPRKLAKTKQAPLPPLAGECRIIGYTYAVPYLYGSKR